MSVWSLGHEIRAELKKRIRRTKAFNVGIEDRNNLREVWSLFKKLHLDTDKLRIAAISSTEWMSEYRTISGRSIVLIDFEQINALGFQLALRIKRELPIFHFVEYLARLMHANA
jgi:hypothetical protein